MSDPPVIVFDVNETLLDFETMAPTFERLFDDKSALRLWFSNLILCNCVEGAKDGDRQLSNRRRRRLPHLLSRGGRFGRPEAAAASWFSKR
jgi:hypothetical protein